MYGVLFTEGETGSKICCGICQSEAEEGYDLSSVNNAEYMFLEHVLQDVSNWWVNDCCKDRFAGMCADRGFRFSIVAEPPAEIVDQMVDVGDVSSELFKEINPDHEFYFVKTADGDALWGYLFEHSEWEVILFNCHKLDDSGRWVPIGSSHWWAKNEVALSVDRIIAIEKAPNIKSNPKEVGVEKQFEDRGFGSFEEIVDAGSPMYEKMNVCKICDKPLAKHSFEEQAKCSKRYKDGGAKNNKWYNSGFPKK